MLLAVLLPIVFGLLVGVYAGDIQIPKMSCPPHTWSYVHMTQLLVCVKCSKQSDIHPFI